MCGESARTRRQLSSGSSRLQLAILGGDFLRVARAFLGLRLEGRRLEHVVEQLRGDLRRARVDLRPRRSRRSRRLRAQRSDRRRAPPPSGGSSRPSARLRRGSRARPAPRRASVGAARDARSATASGRAGSAGCRARTRRRRRGRRPPGAPASRAGAPGCRAGRRRASLRGGPSLRPRPCGASGRVSSHAISCFSASRSRTSAPSGAVAATPIFISVGRRGAATSRALLCGARRRCGR